MDAWLVTLIISQFVFLAFLLWLAVNHHQKNLQRRSEERTRILERFGSGQELAEFLESESGSRFLELFGVKARNPAGMVIAGLVLGIILVFLGAAFLLLVRLEDPGFIMAAVILLASALGVLAATATSYVLARRFRLLSSKPEPTSGD